MLIDIIKESENKFEDQFPFLYTEIYDGKLDDTNEVKDFLHSSQLALLEGLKKEVEGMMKRPDCPCKDWDTSPCSVHSKSKSADWIRIGNNSALSQVISSLEESITYLKSK